MLYECADYNIVTVVMHNKKLDLDAAVKYVSDLHDELAERFLENKSKILNDQGTVLTRNTRVRQQVAAYIDGLGMLTLHCRRNKVKYFN